MTIDRRRKRRPCHCSLCLGVWGKGESPRLLHTASEVEQDRAGAVLSRRRPPPRGAIADAQLTARPDPVQHRGEKKVGARP